MQTHYFHDVGKITIEKEVLLKSGQYQITIRFGEVEIVLISDEHLTIEALEE